jgi:hypothetical protein
MPQNFGKLESQFFGCTDVAGLYAWPPMLGKPYVPYKSYGDQNFLGVPTYQKAQIWIKGPSKTVSQITVLSRMVNANPNYNNRITREWGYKEYDKRELNCRGSWLVLSDVPNDNPNELENYAAQRLLMGGKIGRLKDGGLVVGQKVTVSGQRGSFFGWGGQSYGGYTIADHDVWYWTKLERIGSTGEGAMPDGAFSNHDSRAKTAEDANELKRKAAEDAARQAAQDQRILQDRSR